MKTYIYIYMKTFWTNEKKEFAIKFDLGKEKAITNTQNNGKRGSEC